MKVEGTEKGLSAPAKGYLWTMIALGILALLASQPLLPSSERQWLAFATLTLFAAIAQHFPVVTPKNQAYELTPIFVFAALLLLPPGVVGLLVVISFAPHWGRARESRELRLFNVAIHILQATLSRAVYFDLLGRSVESLDTVEGLGALLPSALAYTVLNHLLVAVFLRLSRQYSWRQTRLFETEYFLTDFTLTCTGAITALLWQTSPWLAALVAAPLFLIYRALGAPVLQEQARTDPKTGLYNARHLQQVLQEELHRAARFDRPLSLIMADLDLLRQVNNSFGHLAGDAVLRGVSDVIGRSLREYDVAARFGGEEFAILLPETGPAQALSVAERLRQQIESASFTVSTRSEPLKVTASLGVASFPADGWDPEQLVHQADLAVYYAKLAGRNRAWGSSPESRALGRLMAGHHELEKLSQSLAPTREVPEAAAGGENSRRGLPEAVRLDLGAPRRGEGPTASPVGGGAPGQGAARWPLSPPDRRRVGRRKREGDPTRALLALTGLVLCTSTVLWGSCRPWEARVDWAGVAALAALAAGAQTLSLEIYGRKRVSAGAASTGVWGVPSVLVLAGGFLFGLPGALMVAPVIPLAAWIRDRGHLHRTLLDLGVMNHSAAAAVGAYSLILDRLPSGEAVILLLPAAAASAVYYCVSVGLLSLAIASRESRSALRVWREEFRWLIPHHLVFGLLAQLLLLAYRSTGLYGLIVFFLPPVLLRHVMKQSNDRTEESVTEVRRINQELLTAHEEVVDMLGELRSGYDATLTALSLALDHRESETEGHSLRVAGYALAIARELGLPDQEAAHLRTGALLHDVGKIEVPDAILGKTPPLAPAEWATLKRHPELGYQMLRHIGFLSSALPVVRHHHERYDGGGYPEGLAGGQIPRSARVFAVVDAFDAMTSDRPYRMSRTLEQAREEIARCSGTQFDPEVVEAFLRIDPAELARLSGRKAVQEVCTSLPTSPLSPLPPTSTLAAMA